MILLKRHEIDKNKTSLTSRFAKSLEHTLGQTFDRIQSIFRMLNKKTLIALVQFITFHVLYRIRKVYVEIKHRTLRNPHGKKMIDAVRGRGEVKNHGASFFLRRISDR
jgi:hypothetical protein